MKTEYDGGDDQQRDPERTENLLPPRASKSMPQARPVGVVNNERRERYRLLKVLAHGGLGTVWVARDDDLNRDIALKELQADPSSRAEFLERFMREAQITGQLEHPNIMPVYELGRRTEDGQPFYTMRLVRGQTLFDAIVAHHRRRQEGTADPLELPRLLNNFIGVCQALAYAHTRGVVHRDLKPENILLGEFGEVIVLDWGLAKLQNQQEITSSLTLTESGNPNMTVAGHVLGTPAYMAPEQAQGLTDAIDWRTDIYGLGAILFDILTGQPPHEGEDIRDVVSRVALEATPRARTSNPTIPPALDAICARAMAFDRDGRYRTAKELADDVERWLAGEPVSVYPEPLTQRLSRWGKKHRTLVASAAALTLTAVVALGIGVALLTREQNRTMAAQARAEANFLKAREAVDKMLRQLAQDQLNDIPHMEQVRRGLLQEALLFYQDFLTQKSDDPELRLELAQAHHQLGEIHRLLNDHKAAHAAYDQAISEFGRLAHEYPGRAIFRRGLAASENKLGELHRETGDPAEAEKAYRRAAAIQQELIANEPDVASYQQELAQMNYNIGLALFATGRFEEAQQAHEKAVALLEPLVRMDPNEPLYRQELARAYLNRASVQRARKMPVEAEAANKAAIQLLEDLVKHAPFSREYQRELAVVHVNLGNLLALDKERRDEADKSYQSALTLFTGLVDNFQFIPLYRKELANCHNSIGSFHERGQRLEQAEQAYARAEKLYAELSKQFPNVPEYHGLLGGTLGNLGGIQLKLGKLDEARKLLDSAIFHERMALNANLQNPTYRLFLRFQYGNLAEVSRKQRRYQPSARAADEIAKLYPDNPTELARAARLVALCLADMEADTELPAAERAELGRELADRAIDLYRRAFAKGYKDRAALEKSPAYDTLSKRADFMQLLK